MTAGWRNCPHRYIVITISTGTEPSNKLWYVEVAGLPVSAATGGMDLSAYDLRKGAAAQPLPIVKLIDDFSASWALIASDGPVWTLNTNLNAPRNQCGAAQRSSRCLRGAHAHPLIVHARPPPCHQHGFHLTA